MFPGNFGLFWLWVLSLLCVKFDSFPNHFPGEKKTVSCKYCVHRLHLAMPSFLSFQAGSWIVELKAFLSFTQF